MTRPSSSSGAPLKSSLIKSVAFAKRAENDETTLQALADTRVSDQILMLGEVIRDVVRREVRIEVAKIVPVRSATPVYLSAAEYATTRSISVSTVRNAIRNGRLPAIKIGAAIRVRADVEIGEPIVTRSERRPVSPSARGAEIFEARRKRSGGRSEIKRGDVTLQSEQREVNFAGRDPMLKKAGF